jgi:hypothetical protein
VNGVLHGLAGQLRALEVAAGAGAGAPAGRKPRPGGA